MGYTWQAKTKRTKNVRVTLDGRALNLSRREAGVGLAAVADEIIARADVPDARPYGQGLVLEGGTATFVDGDRVGGLADAPEGQTTDGIVGYAGFPFPAAFQELGTVRQPARPFLSPAAASTANDGTGIIARETRMGRR